MKSPISAALLLLLCTLSQAQTILQQFAAISAGAGVTSDMDLVQPTTAGSTLIAMPELLTPGITVESVTDNAGNVYKKIKNASSSCTKRLVDIWYCENCKGDVIELKFHLSDHTQGSINSFVEVAGLASSDVVDGKGTHVDDKQAESDGHELGPSIKTNARDFVVARFSSSVHPKAVAPNLWTYKPTYVYGLNLSAGTYQPILIGEDAGASFCISMAPFRIATSTPAASSPAPPQTRQ